MGAGADVVQSAQPPIPVWLTEVGRLKEGGLGAEGVAVDGSQMVAVVEWGPGSLHDDRIAQTSQPQSLVRFQRVEHALAQQRTQTRPVFAARKVGDGQQHADRLPTRSGHCSLRARRGVDVEAQTLGHATFDRDVSDELVVVASDQQGVMLKLGELTVRAQIEEVAAHGQAWNMRPPSYQV